MINDKIKKCLADAILKGCIDGFNISESDEYIKLELNLGAYFVIEETLDTKQWFCDLVSGAKSVEFINRNCIAYAIVLYENEEDDE